MPKFIYKAKTSPTEIIESSIEAVNRDDAIKKINELGYFPLEVKEEKSEARPREDFSFSFSKRIKSNHLVIFTRQLSDLLDSGLTVLQSIELIQKQTQQADLKQIVSEVGDFITDGNSLSAALSRYPRVFDNFYVSIVKSGEIGGSLSAVLKRLADFSEREEEIKSKIRASLAYPVLIATIGALTIFVLLTFVVPKLVLMFTELSENLPLPTVMLINLSNFFARFWWAIFVVVALVVLYIKRLSKTSEGKFAIDRFKLSIPFFGDFIKKSQIGHFTRTLATLLANGVTIIQALDSVIEVLDNELLRQDTRRMLNEVTDGSSLTSAISKSKYFPEVVVNLVAVGEQSGTPEKSLFKVAESFERQTDQMIKVITSLLEPLLILVVGLVVGFIVISMLLPIFQMNLVIS
ncbi:MAG: type II secretion system F family protein [Candidatus Omnitrophota bacterium]